jgi:hypothetical protein
MLRKQLKAGVNFALRPALRVETQDAGSYEHPGHNDSLKLL